MNKRLSTRIVAWVHLALFAALVCVVAGCVGKTDKGNASRLKLTLIQYNESPLSELSCAGIKDGLTQLGMNDGIDYRLDIKNAQGDLSTLNMILDLVASQKPDLIFVTSTPTLQAAAKKITTIPIVFTVVADPIEAGVCTSFQEHQSNVTGISTMGDYQGMIDWLTQLKPQVKTIGTLYTPGEVNSVKNMETLKQCAKLKGITLITVPVSTPTDVTDAAYALLSKQVEVVCQVIDNLTSATVTSVIKVCRDQNLPFFGFVSDQADKGAVLVVSRDYHQAGVDAVNLARKILDGQSVNTVPIEFVSKTNVLINPAQASLFGMEVPKALLELPGVVVIKETNSSKTN